MKKAQNTEGVMLFVYIIAICTQPMDKTKYALEPTVQLISDTLKDVKEYKKVVAEMLKQFEKK